MVGASGEYKGISGQVRIGQHREQAKELSEIDEKTDKVGGRLLTASGGVETQSESVKGLAAFFEGLGEEKATIFRAMVGGGRYPATGEGAAQDRPETETASGAPTKSMQSKRATEGDGAPHAKRRRLSSRVSGIFSRVKPEKKEGSLLSRAQVAVSGLTGKLKGKRDSLRASAAQVREKLFEKKGIKGLIEKMKDPSRFDEALEELREKKHDLGVTNKDRQAMREKAREIFSSSTSFTVPRTGGDTSALDEAAIKKAVELGEKGAEKAFRAWANKPGAKAIVKTFGRLNNMVINGKKSSLSDDSVKKDQALKAFLWRQKLVDAGCSESLVDTAMGRLTLEALPFSSIGTLADVPSDEVVEDVEDLSQLVFLQQEEYEFSVSNGQLSCEAKANMSERSAVSGTVWDCGLTIKQVVDEGAAKMDHWDVEVEVKE